MRYYRIELYKTKNVGQPGLMKSGPIYTPPSLSAMAAQGCTWTSYVTGSAIGGNMGSSGGTGGTGGLSIPGALNVEFDISVVAQGLPDAPGQWFRVWGISLDEVKQANELFGYGAVIYGGFRQGLPLAKPQQSQAPLTSGWIVQSFGNWKKTELTLDFMVTAGGFVASMQQPARLIFNWQPNTKLADAIKATISSGLPGTFVNINISDMLTSKVPQWGVYGTLAEFREAIVKISRRAQYKGIGTVTNNAYAGIDIIVAADGSVIVTDNSVSQFGGNITPGTAGTIAPGGAITPGTQAGVVPLQPGQVAIRINYEDLIGQPTWIDVQTIQFQCPMRSDIYVNNQVTLPAGLALTAGIPQGAGGTVQPFGNVRNQITFSGTFLVTKVRHVGNFRSASGDAWVTIIDAILTGRNTAWTPPLAPGVNPNTPYVSPKR